MSTIVVVKKNGIAAIGADTLTKFGSIRESAKYIDNHSKIVCAGDNYMAHVGHASFGLVTESYFLQMRSLPKLDSPQAIFRMARAFHASLKEDYFLNPTEDSDDPFESIQHQSLIANQFGIFGLYSLRSVQEYTCFYSFGSGSEFALGAMHAVYNLDLSAEEIARAGLLAGAEFDHSTGEPIEIKTVNLKQK